MSFDSLIQTYLYSMLIKSKLYRSLLICKDSIKITLFFNKYNYNLIQDN